MNSMRCLIVVFSLFLICADLSQANIFGDLKNAMTGEGGEITDIGNGQFDIAVAGGLSGNRGVVYKTWNRKAKMACNGGEYKIIQRDWQSVEYPGILGGIIECNQTSRAQVARPAAPQYAQPTSSAQQRQVYTPPSNNQAPQNYSGFINMIRSQDSMDVRDTAQKMYRERIFDDALLQSVNEVLLSGYRFNNGRTHADAMAWLCKVLGASGQQKYMSTLNEVAMNGATKKLKKYAASSM